MTIGEEIEAVAFVAAWENYYNYRTQLVSARIALKANAADVNTGSYLGMFAAAPSDKVTGDWYLNSGDGLIRIWNGTAWTTSGVTWLHKIAAIEDLYSIAASASQVFTSMIVASEAFIEELASKTIKSAELCEDGTTSRVEFQLNDAILLFRNASQTLLQQISEAAFTSYEGAGAYRKAVRISGNKLTWVNAPEGGSEVEVSRMLRDPAENRVRLEGLFGKYNAEKIFEQQTLSASNYNTNDVAWSPSLGLFVACGGTGTLCFTSPDGITWTQRTVSATARTWSKIAWSSSLGLFVMVAAGTVCATSPDGTNWTERTISATSRTWQAIAWSEDLGLFVIGAYGVAVCATSPDGTTWTERSLPVTAYPSEIVWSSSLGLFVMNSATMGTFCLTSPSGTTWTQRTISGTSRLWRGLEWSPELGLFILTAAGYVATSPDGTTWTERTVSAISGTPGVVKWSSSFGFFLLIPYGSGSTAYTSEDGINWTARPMGLTASWVGLTWSPDRGIFVMVANSTTKCLTLRELGYSELVTINDITTSYYFKARKNSSQSVTANVTNITFPLVDEDPYGTFDGTTFTAPADGLYLFLYQRFAPSAGASAFLFRNGVGTPTAICTTSGYDS